MWKLRTILPVIAGAIAGAIVALVLTSGGGSRTVTTNVVTTAGPAPVPASFSKVSGLNINEIYKRDINGVVDIDVTTRTKANSGFFGSQPQQSEDEGAGVVYDTKGDIITDEHVVANAVKVTVNFEDGYKATAKVLGTDPSSDVAVIRAEGVPSSELHPIAFADSSSAQVGDPVVAIGSPFGLPGTTTSGIVSAVGRSITAPNNYTIPGAIQTDAAINPGNSGGPLLDANGRVLGLNDQIQTSSGDSAGVGFATPGNTDVKVANTIIAGKPVQHPYVGVCLQDSSTGGAEIATSSGNGCTTGPIVVGSPAAQAGLEPGDVITAVDGKRITSSDSFISVISTYQPGDTVTMTVRRSGHTKQIKVKLGDRPRSAPTAG